MAGRLQIRKAALPLRRHQLAPRPMAGEKQNPAGQPDDAARTCRHSGDSVKAAPDIDGHSFLPVLKGETSHADLDRAGYETVTIELSADAVQNKPQLFLMIGVRPDS